MKCIMPAVYWLSSENDYQSGLRSADLLVSFLIPASGERTELFHK